MALWSQTRKQESGSCRSCKNIEDFRKRYFNKLFKVTLYLQRCLQKCLGSKRCSASGLSCRYLNPYMKLKLLELAIKINQEFWIKMNCRIFSAVFQINFFTWRSHFKELKLKRNLFVCLQTWTVASLTYKQQRRVFEFFLSKYFFSESDFSRSLHIFFILFRKWSITFHCDWI